MLFSPGHANTKNDGCMCVAGATRCVLLHHRECWVREYVSHHLYIVYLHSQSHTHTFIATTPEILCNSHSCVFLPSFLPFFRLVRCAVLGYAMVLCRLPRLLQIANMDKYTRVHIGALSLPLYAACISTPPLLSATNASCLSI